MLCITGGPVGLNADAVSMVIMENHTDFLFDRIDRIRSGNILWIVMDFFPQTAGPYGETLLLVALIYNLN